MTMSEKICPYLSTGHPAYKHEQNQMIMCQENKCQLWIEVFTTEMIRVQGCAIALKLQMVDGLLRV